MAGIKRLIDSDMWDDAWFCELPPVLKVAWIYIILKAGAGGVWKPNYKRANEAIGEMIDWEAFLKRCGPKRAQLIEGTEGYWWIPKWLSFQLGAPLNFDGKEMQRNHRTHVSALEQYNLIPYFLASGLPYKGIPPGQTATVEKGPPKSHTDLAGMPDHLREHPVFFRAWGDWLDHLSEHGKPYSQLTKMAVWQECLRQGPDRSAVCIRYSIKRGWKSIAWDAPTAGGPPPGVKIK